MADKNGQKEMATLGGGCFWCLEAVYQEVEGVEKVISGYAGGDVADPSYEAVCTGRTGHAEVVQVLFDPDVTSYREILEIFFAIHDPTTLNRQGADVGTQYRSIIFYHDEDQKETAEAVMAEAQAAWDRPVVTELTPAETFYEAEAYHQNYYRNNPYQGYCRAVVAPKLKKFRKTFAEKRKAAA
ncbi:MAG: peptide-methionine (S)-S-oxide reductase MsrA [Candidatus Promineifilaceae bacterium]|nr:peptide-methionine (S)-S-oxide reductase MsrA [Candidatus Promineifilaceae bacterium]